MTLSPHILAAVDRWRATRMDYQVYLEAQYEAATQDLNGALLNARGRAARVSSMSLFPGPRSRADAYASRELIEWWTTHGRITFAAWERQHCETPGHEWGTTVPAAASALGGW